MWNSPPFILLSKSSFAEVMGNKKLGSDISKLLICPLGLGLSALLPVALY